MTGVDAIKLAAWEAHRAGLCVVPPREDGSKRPFGAEWTTYQQRQPTLDELRAWYANGRQGVGGVMGAVSGNTELFEFDSYDTYLAFKESAIALGLGPLIARIEQGYSEATPGGGIHWYYRCDEIGGSKELAKRPNGVDDQGRQKWQVLIETKGEGGYAVFAPSRGGVHPSGKPYAVLAGTFATIAAISPRERADLWDLARGFDESPAREEAPAREQAASAGRAGDRPGDDFARRVSWDDILSPAGWVRLSRGSGEKGFWRRPGKDEGWSATTNYAGRDLFHCFTSSTEFQKDRSYGKFSAYAILNHGGDFAAAARELGRQGYGEPREARSAKLGSRRVLDEATGEYTEETIDPNDYELTDTGNGELFAALYAGQYRYDHRRGKWYRWADHWWRGESDRHARLSSKEIARQRMAAARTIDDETERKAAFKWAKASASSAHRDSLLKRAADEIELAADGDDWDTDPFLLGVGNGVVDLRSGLLRPGDPDDRVTMRTPIPFDPHAAAPRWERFLAEVFEDDAEQVAWLARMVGYSLTGDISEHAFVVCFGGGSNGKSTLFTILNHLLGDYAGALNFSALAHTLYEAHPTELAALMGKRFVTASELNEGQRLNEARIKGLTGGDIIKARFMRQDEFEFRPALKLWLAVNHKPVVKDDSRGFWRRMRLLEFRRSFPVNHELEPQLRSEAPGILAWAVRGCLTWQAQGLGSTRAIDEATRAYREDSDPIGAFVAECCSAGEQLASAAKDLIAAYESWSKEQGQREDERLGSKTFYGRMAERYHKKREAGGVIYRGVALNAAWQERVTRPSRFSG